MKKINLFILIIVCINNSINAQVPLWNWAMNAQCSGSYEYGYGVKIGSTGDLFATGRFANDITMGGVSSVPGSGTPIYVARTTNAGTVKWIKKVFSSGSFDYTYAMAIDHSDNTYVGFNSSSGSASGVIKCDSTGVIVWTSTAVSSSSSGDGVGVDLSGNVYLTGYFSGTINFGSTVLSSTGGSYDMFLAKYNSAGVLQWAVKAGGSGYDVGKGIAIDASGNIYVVGGYTGTPTFGTLTAPASGTYSNLFIAKYSPLGVALSVVTAANAGIANNAWWEQNEITIDPCDNLYVTGHFENTANFGGMNITSAGGDDIFVAKCNNSGAWEWAKSAGGAGNEQGLGIALDNELAVYVTGYFQGVANFEGTSLTAVGSSDVFVMKYARNTQGNCSNSGSCAQVNLQWVQQGTGTGDDNANQISVDNNKRVYITGSFTGTTVFGTISIPSTGSGDILIARLDSVPNRTIVPALDSTYCIGNISFVPYVAMGIFNSGNTFTAQLSDLTGNFANPVNVGGATSSASGTISITIPIGIPSGTGYRIRIVSSAPVFAGTDACFNITINAAPLITVNSTALCSGQAANLIASGGTSYVWSIGATSTGVNTATATPLTTTTYTVTGISNGCSNTAISTVTVNATPVITVNSPVVCGGQTANLTAVGGTSYTWSPGITSTGVNTATVIPASTTSYTVTATNNGCSDTAVSTVTVHPTPIITVNSPSVCNGQTANLTVSGATSYAWSAGATPTGISTATAAPSTTTTYTVTGTANGCSNAGISTVTISPKPNADFTIASNGCSVTFTNLTTGAISYLWSFGDGSTSVDETPNYTFTQTQPPAVLLIATNSLGCVDSISKKPELKGTTLFIPNTFTPNGDGQNEIFKVSGASLSTFEATIFNRWGEKIYSWNDPETGWDGTFKGKSIDAGVYVYLITAGNLCGGNPDQYYGMINVLK
jgi:gliding motility-associated-like protein